MLKIEEYLANVKAGESAKRMYRSVLSRLNDYLITNGLRLNTESVAKFLSQFKPSLADRYAWVVVNYCKWAGCGDVDVAYIMRRFRAAFRQSYSTLSRDEVERIINACPQPHRVILLMAYTYARRIGEVLTCRIRGSEVHFTLEKIGGEVSFPLTERVRRELDDCIRVGKCMSGEFPFMITTRAVEIAFKKCLAKAGVSENGRRITVHSLRGSRISHLVEQGYPLEQVTKTLRTHTNIQVAYEYYLSQLDVNELLSK